MSRNETLKDHASHFIDNNLYIPTKTIYLSGDVDEKLANNIIKNLHVLDKMNSDETITIIINSGGGNVIDGFAIYDAIKNCTRYVRGIVKGQASSMASIILQACDERVISTHSTIMIHDGTVGYEDSSITTVNTWQKWQEDINERCYDIYLEKMKQKTPKLRKQDLKRYIKDDMVYLGEEAVNHGLADRILKRGD